VIQVSEGKATTSPRLNRTQYLPKVLTGSFLTWLPFLFCFPSQRTSAQFFIPLPSAKITLWSFFPRGWSQCPEEFLGFFNFFFFFIFFRFFFFFFPPPFGRPPPKKKNRKIFFFLPTNAVCPQGSIVGHNLPPKRGVFPPPPPPPKKKNGVGKSRNANRQLLFSVTDMTVIVQANKIVQIWQHSDADPLRENSLSRGWERKFPDPDPLAIGHACSWNFFFGTFCCRRRRNNSWFCFFVANGCERRCQRDIGRRPGARLKWACQVFAEGSCWGHGSDHFPGRCFGMGPRFHSFFFPVPPR